MRDNNKKGFTLIELLIVVVIIGILAAIAIPKFSATRERAFIASMKSDLKNTMSLQEMFYADPANAYTYATANVTAPATDAGLGLTPSEGVTVNTAPSGDGFSVTVTHQALPGENCTVDTNTGAANPGAIVCTM